jgi:anti-sigma-K factor RskA
VKYTNPQFRDAVAAEYVLGTLQGAARRRFERSLKDDPRLRQLVAQWQERLAPLDEMIEPIKPPARVWRSIEERVSAGSGRRRWWSDVPFWRGASIVSAACALLLAVYIALVIPREREMMVVVMSADQGAPAMTVSWPMQSRGAPKLRIRVMGHPDMPPGTSWELWMLPGADQKPVSLGLIGTAPMQELPIPAQLAPMINRAAGLAMSQEPAGGSPTGLPTGPVLYKGLCTRI